MNNYSIQVYTIEESKNYYSNNALKELALNNYEVKENYNHRLPVCLHACIIFNYIVYIYKNI